MKKRKKTAPPKKVSRKRRGQKSPKQQVRKVLGHWRKTITRAKKSLETTVQKVKQEISGLARQEKPAPAPAGPGTARVLLIAGSKSDISIMQEAQKILQDFEVESAVHIASAHRSPELAREIAKGAEKECDLIIAGAGMAAHLPGMVAAHTVLPVIGIPIKSEALDGLDALLSIVQMPTGVPVATVAIGGAKNAALLAVQILGLKYPQLRERLRRYKESLAQAASNVQLA